MSEKENSIEPIAQTAAHSLTVMTGKSELSKRTGQMPRPIPHLHICKPFLSASLSFVTIFVALMIP